MLLLLSLLSLFLLKLCTTQVSSRNVCSSEECKRASQLILNNLDTTVDPCVDMYQFSCGGWIQKNVIPKGHSSWSVDDKMEEQIQKNLIKLIKEDGWDFRGKKSNAVKKLKHFYKSCIDVQKLKERGAKPLIKLIDDIGSWTVTKTKRKWNREKWDLQKALQEAHKIVGPILMRSSFWFFYIYRDEKNASRNIIHLYQSGLTLFTETAFYNTAKVKERYMNISMTIGQLLGGDCNTVEAKMSEVYNFEKSLAEIYTLDLYDPVKAYNLMTLSQFQTMVGDWIDMEKYMETRYGKGVMTSDTELVVSTLSYFVKLQELINSTDKEVLANYLMWNLLVNTVSYLPDEFSVADIWNLQPVEGMKELDPRQDKCLKKSRDLMPFVTSALYVDRYLSQETVAMVVSALDNIKHQFISNLNQMTWLDKETRNNLNDKSKALTYQVGYPNWILDPIKLDAMYENLVVEEDNYFQNFIHSAKYLTGYEKFQLIQPPDRLLWLWSPDTVNSYYHRLNNEVLVLAGFIQEPLVSKDYPTSYFYGSLGAILAHEIIHGFDSTGRLFSKDGNLKDNWTPHVAKEFDKRAQCFIDQYNNFTFYGHNISGQLSLGENIADNVGVKLAYRAYKSSNRSHELPLPGLNLTDDQLYFVGVSHFHCANYTKDFGISFMSYAPHALRHFRIHGTSANSKEFSKAFNCPVNSPMNPKKKCEVW